MTEIMENLLVLKDALSGCRLHINNNNIFFNKYN